MESGLSTLIASLPGVVLPYAGASAPGGFLLCYGQAIDRTAYGALFGVIGTTYGVGNGTTTFNVPDLRGRVPAGLDNMGGASAGIMSVSLSGSTTNGNAIISALSSTAGLAVGMRVFGTGIAANATIASIDSATQVTLSANSTVTATVVSIRFGVVDANTRGAVGGAQAHTLTTPQIPSHNHSLGGSYNTNRSTNSGGSENILSQLTVTNTGNTGGGQAHPNVQPTIILNYIIKT